MKVVINTPKNDVFQYFKRGGEFQNELRNQSTSSYSNLLYSNVMNNQVVKFNIGTSKKKRARMKISSSESTSTKTVFNASNDNSYLIIGILLLPVCLIGIFFFNWTFQQ